MVDESENSGTTAHSMICHAAGLLPADVYDNPSQSDTEFLHFISFDHLDNVQRCSKAFEGLGRCRSGWSIRILAVE